MIAKIDKTFDTANRTRFFLLRHVCLGGDSVQWLVVSVQLGGSRRGIDAAANWPLATDH